MAELRDRLIKEYMAAPIEKGFVGTIPYSLISSWKRDGETVRVIVDEVLPDGRLRVHKMYNEKENGIVDEAQFKRSPLYIGANPFPANTWRSHMQVVNYDIEGILNRLDDSIRYGKGQKWEVLGHVVENVSFDPYVTDSSGNKRYYQRDLCWTLEDKQLFIESIYKGINCGMILVRERSWKAVEAEVRKGNYDTAFFDVVDGKQRADCLLSFVKDGFKDLHGCYFSDLSDYAKHLFENSQSISYGVLKDITDEETIEAFLNVNFAGKPMSKEHIKYVEDIADKMRGKEAKA